MLENHLQNCLEEYELCSKNHWLSLESFEQLRRMKLDSVKEQFMRQTKLIAEEFMRERKMIEKQHQSKVRALEELRLQIKVEEEEKDALVKDAFQQEKEDIKDKNADLMELMETEMNAKKVNIYNALEHLFHKFMKDSRDKYREFMKISDSNEVFTTTIIDTNRRILRNQDRIQVRALKMLQLEREFESRNRLIRKENTAISRNFLELKNKMFAFRASQHRRLIRLVSNSRKVQSGLKKILMLGERILKTAEFCRKLETVEERVLPFSGVVLPGGSVLDGLAEEIDKLVRETQSPDEKKLDIGQLLKFEALRNFVEKYNKVFLDYSALTIQNKKLKKENEELKAKAVRLLDRNSMPANLAQNFNSLKVSKSKIFSNQFESLMLIRRQEKQKENVMYQNVGNLGGKI